MRMKKKKWITILSLLLLAVLLAANTPSFLNADGENAGGEKLIADDFTAMDIVFARSDKPLPEVSREHNITFSRTGETPYESSMYFLVKFDLTKITAPGVETPDTTRKKRLMPGDYFTVDLPAAFTSHPNDKKGVESPSLNLYHPDDKDKKFPLAKKTVIMEDGVEKLKFTFTEHVNSNEYKNNVKGEFYFLLLYMEKEYGVEKTHQVGTPVGNIEMKTNFKFTNTDNDGEILYKGGASYVAPRGNKPSAFTYYLRLNITRQNLGKVVLTDELKDGFGGRDLEELKDVHYLPESFSLTNQHFKQVNGRYSTSREKVKAFFSKDQLLKGDGETTPKLVIDEVNKKFTLTIPNVGTDTYVLNYATNNPNNKKRLNNTATVQNNGELLFPDDAHKKENKKEFTPKNFAELVIKQGGSIIADSMRGTLEIKKLGSDSKLLQGVMFKLERLDKNGAVEETLPAKVTDENGRVTFDGLKLGKYKVVEESTLPEYELLKNPIDVEIKDETAVYLNLENKLKEIPKKEVPKIDVEVTKVCKIDPQNPTAPKTPAAQDQGSDVTLVLERKLGKEGSAFEPVKDSQNNPLEVVLKKDQEKVTFPQVDKTDANGTLYVYRVVEKEVAGQTPSNLEFSTPVVEENKTSIEVTKDCSAPKKDEPKQAEKIDVEVTKVCKIDPQNPNAPKTPAAQDQGGDVTLVLERKLNKDGSAFEPVKDSQNNPLEVVLKKDQEKVTFPQVDKADENGTLYVYRVVEKEVAGQTPSNLEFSTPVVEENKTSIEVTKDCSAPKVEDPKKEEPKKEEPKLPATNKPEEPKKEEPSEEPSSNEGSGTVSKVERIETPVTSEEKKEEKTPEKPQVGITAEGTVVENNETNVLPGNVPADSSTKTSKNNKAVDPANKKLPKTGEGLNASAYAAIALLGGALLVAYGVFRKKRNQA